LALVVICAAALVFYCAFGAVIVEKQPFFWYSRLEGEGYLP